MNVYKYILLPILSTSFLFLCRTETQQYHKFTDKTWKIMLPSEKNFNFFDPHQTFDLFSPYSYEVFVDKEHPSKVEIFKDIRRLNSVFLYGDGNIFSLREEAATKFELMARAFSHAFNFQAKFSINSAYRNTAFQRKLYAILPHQQVAKPWTSEHELGLAVDLGVNGKGIETEGGKYYKRMQENAYKYGFHNSYQKWIEIDGQMKETRHWRYVGVDLAMYLHKMDMTFSEYFHSQESENSHN